MSGVKLDVMVVEARLAVTGTKRIRIDGNGSGFLGLYKWQDMIRAVRVRVEQSRNHLVSHAAFVDSGQQLLDCCRFASLGLAERTRLPAGRRE